MKTYLKKALLWGRFWVLTQLRKFVLGRHEYWVGIPQKDDGRHVLYRNREDALHDMSLFNYSKVVHVVEIEKCH